MAKSMGAQHLSIISYAQLIINQVNQEYQARDKRMALYLRKVRALLNAFETSSIEQVPPSKNGIADSLARLALSYETDLSRTVLVEIISESSLTEPDMMDIDKPDAPDLRTSIRKHLETG